jgi:hypothetical protein
MVNPLTHRSISLLPNLGSSLLHEFLDAFNDELKEVQEEATADDAPLSADLEPDPPADLLINAAKGSTPNQLPPGDIHRVMSKNSKHSIHTACIEYKVSYHKEHHGISPSPVHRGANKRRRRWKRCPRYIQTQLYCQ